MLDPVTGYFGSHLGNGALVRCITGHQQVDTGDETCDCMRYRCHSTDCELMKTTALVHTKQQQAMAPTTAVQ